MLKPFINGQDDDVDETCQYEMPKEEDHGGPHLASPRDTYSENCRWNFPIWQKEENTDYEYQLRLELKRNFGELSVIFSEFERQFGRERTQFIK